MEWIFTLFCTRFPGSEKEGSWLLEQFGLHRPQSALVIPHTRALWCQAMLHWRYEAKVVQTPRVPSMEREQSWRHGISPIKFAGRLLSDRILCVALLCRYIAWGKNEEAQHQVVVHTSLYSFSFLHFITRCSLCNAERKKKNCLFSIPHHSLSARLHLLCSWRDLIP